MPALCLAALGSQPYFAACDAVRRRALGFNAGLPSTAYCVTSSPDGAVIAVAHGGSPNVTLYDSATLGKLPNLSPLVPGTAYGVAFSPDGNLLATINASTPAVNVYDMTTKTRIAGPSTIPTMIDPACCAFSPDGSIFVVAHQTSPYITRFRTSDWSVLPNLPTTPEGVCWWVAFSPDGSTMAVAHANGHRVSRYDTTTWGRGPAFSSLPNGDGYGCSYSPDGKYLAVVHANAPYVSIYNLSTGAKLPTPAVTPTSAPDSCAFSHDSKYLALSARIGSSLIVYRTDTWDVDPHMAVVGEVTTKRVAFLSTAPRTIRGEVRGTGGEPVSRTVCVYNRDTKEIAATTVSDPVTGEYEAKVYDGDVEYNVQFMSPPGELLNDLFFAKARSGTP